MATRYGGPFRAASTAAPSASASLRLGRPGRSAKVVEPVPDLDHDQGTRGRVADGDVDGARRIGRTSRELEVGLATVPAGKAQHRFLRGEVARITRVRLIDLAREAHGQRPIDRLAQLDPCLERRRRAVATLELADSSWTQANASTELRLGQPAPPPRGLEDVPKCAGDRSGLGRAFQFGSGSPMSVHAAGSITRGTNLAISPRERHGRRSGDDRPSVDWVGRTVVCGLLPGFLLVGAASSAIVAASRPGPPDQ
jgi:hypothetical protein